jgi:hypothetical protein
MEPNELHVEHDDEPSSPPLSGGVVPSFHEWLDSPEIGSMTPLSNKHKQN